MIFASTNVFETAGILCFGAGGYARYLSILCLRKGAHAANGPSAHRPSLGGAVIGEDLPHRPCF